ncbi:MAG: DUF3164 family protein [Prevotellaceae bacterium]|jgi:hypothetical protein|nr:DUF3164 family protein [Prevotellaceae bacterium]
MEKEEKTQQVEMTAAEQLEFEAFKTQREAKERKRRERENREAYKAIVNEAIDTIFPELQKVSESLQSEKSKVYEAFQQALVMKADVYGIKEEQNSNTFTNSAGNRRIVLGQYTVDNYDDTVNEGIAKVKEFIGSLAKDRESSMLVNAILKLLSKDQKGNLKASRVIQLRKMAEESGNEAFIDGVRIIQDAYRPAVSKYYVRAEYMDEKQQWKNVPLGMTEA